LTNAIAISAGEEDACGVLTNGAIECSGTGATGELGDGQTDNSPVPVEVQIP
jgi:hypothetical protein